MFRFTYQELPCIWKIRFCLFVISISSLFADYKILIGINNRERVREYKREHVIHFRTYTIKLWTPSLSGKTSTATRKYRTDAIIDKFSFRFTFLGSFKQFFSVPLSLVFLPFCFFYIQVNLPLSECTVDRKSLSLSFTTLIVYV